MNSVQMLRFVKLQQFLGRTDPVWVGNVEFYVCGLLIACFLGVHVERDQRFGAYINRDTVQDYTYACRIYILGVMLFALRNEEYFPELCRRFQGRDIISSCYEMMSIYICRTNGCAIALTPETGVRGKDFDFKLVTPPGTLVSAEATVLRPAIIGKNTIKNALLKKRKQLPSSTPGIIFLAFPEIWQDNEPRLVERVTTEVESFLRSTERVNAVVTTTERHRPVIYDLVNHSNGMITFPIRTFHNKSPRHIADLCFLGRNIIQMSDEGGEFDPRDNVFSREGLREWADEFVRFVR